MGVTDARGGQGRGQQECEGRLGRGVYPRSRLRSKTIARDRRTRT